MTATIKAVGQDADQGYTYRIQFQQQQPGSAPITVNGQFQVFSKAALPLTLNEQLTLSQLALILDPAS